MEQQRRGPDRREHPRGGRRDVDQRGRSPLVMVLESDVARGNVAEAILATSHFAVAPVVSVEGALAICRALIPSVIVCNEADEGRVRAGLHPLVVPIVLTDPQESELDGLVERIKMAVRGPFR